MLQQYMATATHKFSLPINEKCSSNCARLMDFWQLLCRVAASVCVHMHFNVCRIILMSFLCLVYHLLSTGLLNVATVTANLTISSNIFCLSKLPLALKGQFDMYFCHLCLHATTACSLKKYLLTGLYLLYSQQSFLQQKKAPTALQLYAYRVF